jgi:hypothetical protein
MGFTPTAFLSTHHNYSKHRALAAWGGGRGAGVRFWGSWAGLGNERQKKKLHGTVLVGGLLLTAAVAVPVRGF